MNVYGLALLGIYSWVVNSYQILDGSIRSNCTFLW